MLEKYKVLGAMLTFREFTVKDIADFSEVKQSTVRTIINRHQAFLEELGTDETGRPGGRFTRYAIKAEQIKPLRNIIESLYKQLKVQPEIQLGLASGGEAGATIGEGHEVRADDAVDLLASEDALLRLFPQTESHDERQYLLRLAEFHADNAQAKLNESLESRFSTRESNTNALIFRTRLRGVRVLSKLCQAELLAQNGEETGYLNILELRDELIKVSHELERFEQWKHSAALTQRALGSRLIDLSTEEIKPATAQIIEQAAAAVAGPTRNHLTPIINRVQSISQIDDLQHRRVACASAARDYRPKLYSPIDHDQMSHRVVQRLRQGAVVRLDEREVEVLATEPEFYYLAAEPEYLHQLTFAPQGKGILLNCLSYVEAALDYKSDGSNSGPIAMQLTALIP